MIALDMEKNRKDWNDRHKKLRDALEKDVDRDRAIELFLAQHAIVHSSKISKSSQYSFEDEILTGLSDNHFRKIPEKGNHSIAWILWHLARVEDVTMNILVAGKSQLLHSKGWLDKLGIPDVHTGNGMTDREVKALSDIINVAYLKKYRQATGKETRRIIKRLKADDYAKKVDPMRIQRIWDEKAMLPNARGIANYWAKRTISGLLLMPPTRHCFLHINEARRVREKVLKN